MNISVELNEKDTKLIKAYTEKKNILLVDFVKDAIISKTGINSDMEVKITD